MYADTMWTMVDERRTAAVDVFAGLSDEQWDAPSLCSGWTVRTVGAHLTLQARPAAATLRMALGHPGSLNHVIDASSRARAGQWSTTQIVDGLRALVGVHRPNAFTTVREALVDATVHLLDVTVPLGLTTTVPPATATAVCDVLLAYRGTRKAKVFAPPIDEDTTSTPVDAILRLSGRRTA